MATESLVESKFEASKQLVAKLIEQGAPLLAAYWEFSEDVDRWTLQLVPRSTEEERSLIHEATTLLVDPPYRSIFSISDPAVDSGQINRAKALGEYIRVEPYVGRRIDKTFTSREYFESVVPVFFVPELMTHLRAA